MIIKYGYLNLMLLKSIKKKADKKLTIEIFWISKPSFNLQLFCINNLRINPIVLPIKRAPMELKSKI